MLKIFPLTTTITFILYITPCQSIEQSYKPLSAQISDIKIITATEVNGKLQSQAGAKGSSKISIKKVEVLNNYILLLTSMTREGDTYHPTDSVIIAINHIKSTSIGVVKIDNSMLFQSIFPVSIDFIWLGGSKGDGINLNSMPQGCADLASWNAGKGVSSHHTYCGRGAPYITTILPSSKNRLVVAAQNRGGPPWLASINALTGGTNWENSEGLGEIAVTSLTNHEFAVFSNESVGAYNAEEFHWNVFAQMFDDEGNFEGRVTVRKNINVMAGADFGYLTAAGDADGSYVLSDWETADSETAKTAEVSRISKAGQLLWTTNLPDTYEVSNSITERSCYHPALAESYSGNAVVACILNGKLHLYSIEKASGMVSEAIQEPPDICAPESYSRLFLAQTTNSLFLVHSGACNWLGRLSITD